MAAVEKACRCYQCRAAGFLGPRTSDLGPRRSGIAITGLVPPGAGAAGRRQYHLSTSWRAVTTGRTHPPVSHHRTAPAVMTRRQFVYRAGSHALDACAGREVNVCSSNLDVFGGLSPSQGDWQREREGSRKQSPVPSQISVNKKTRRVTTRADDSTVWKEITSIILQRHSVTSRVVTCGAIESSCSRSVRSSSNHIWKECAGPGLGYWRCGISYG